MTLDLADLHTHTTASDGLDSPDILLDQARSIGLAAIAIADHDTIAGYASLTDEQRESLTIIPAIEMSANVGTSEVHILGYFIDPESTYLLEQLTVLQRQRMDRVARFCARLTKIGLPVTLDEVLTHATGQSVGRPHIARAMVDRGYVTSVNAAFDKYLSGGRPGFVPRYDITPEWCLEFIHKSGGVASLAHPYTTGNPEQMIDRLMRVGLDAVEVEYGIYSPAERQYLASLANRRNLIATGGSDYHGASHREDTPLGAGGVPMATVDLLRHRALRYQTIRP